MTSWIEDVDRCGIVEPSTPHAIENITNAFVVMCHCQMRNEVTAGLTGTADPSRCADQIALSTSGPIPARISRVPYPSSCGPTIVTSARIERPLTVLAWSLTVRGLTS